MIVELIKFKEEGNPSTLETHLHTSLEEWVEKNQEVLVDMENTSWTLMDEGRIRSIVHQTPEGCVVTIYPYWCVYDEKADKGHLVPLSKEEVECELFK